MKLSKLVYEAVKNVKYLEDPSFTLESFIRGEFDDNLDYANSINNAFAPLNEAIHRLSDRNKIKHEVVKLPKANENGMVDISHLTSDINVIISIFYISTNDYKRVAYREFGKDKILITSNWYFTKDLYIQYRKDIKHFSRNDIYFFEDNNGILEHSDVDLKDYGITDTMCSYIIEYCQGKLQEPIAPELANMHITRAEQYFDDLPEQQTEFSQTVIATKYTIE